MDLWIRSQDKTQLLKVIGLYYDYQKEKHHITCITENDYSWIGIYKTKERALEVLDEIQKTIINNEVIRIIMPNVKDMRGNEELYKENVFNTMVYEMPKE